MYAIEEDIELQAPVVRDHGVHAGPYVPPGNPEHWSPYVLPPWLDPERPSNSGLMYVFDQEDDELVNVWDRLVTYYGTVRDGTGHVVDYLTHDAGAGGYVRRFGVEPPVVRVAKGATPEMVSDLIGAVQLINASLPRAWQLGLDSNPAVEDAARPRDGEIVIGFQPGEDWPVEVPTGWTGGGFAQRWFAPRSPEAEIVSARVWIDTGPQAAAHGQARRAAIVHEILYALGRDRLDGTRFGRTIMNGASRGVPGHALHPLDREALLAVYGRLGPNTPTESIAEDLGPWSERSTHLVGEMFIPISGCDDASLCLPGTVVFFGVAERNGLAQPWVTGAGSSSDLLENLRSSGETLSWSGQFLGLTPDNRSVAGRADLRVEVESRDGRLGFSGLESWTGLPGETGTGDRWGDGKLGYDITVRGNTFVQTGGDDGVVTGVFFGNGVGMGGTLKRDDLMAAFGGFR